MTDSDDNDTLPCFRLQVYRAGDFTVISGANLGDQISDAHNLELADVYGLRAAATKTQIAITPDASEAEYSIARGSETGILGSTLHLDCVATFMAAGGSTVEVIILVETLDGMIYEIYMLPLAPIAPKQSYTLITVDRTAGAIVLAQLACTSFSRGTHVLCANGAQVRIEDLGVGDLVMTRDHGAQTIRWIGQQTVRATGINAPVVVAENALNNIRDLTLSPNHRLFIYQRGNRLSTGQPEVMVRAQLLVNDDSITRSEGGFIEYFQLLFDQHEIIYVEGIAAESLLPEPRIRPALPAYVRARLGDRDHSPTPKAWDLHEGDVQGVDVAGELRRASLQ
ncbi:MAG: Hint domain-containing protein [Paracoccaceae bacterium]